MSCCIAHYFWLHYANMNPKLLDVTKCFVLFLPKKSKSYLSEIIDISE